MGFKLYKKSDVEKNSLPRKILYNLGLFFFNYVKVRFHN